MEPEEYDAMFALEDSLWWYQGQRKIARALLSRFLPRLENLSVLDCGAGTGGSLALLKPLGEVTALEYSELGARLYARREDGRLSRASAAAMPFADSAFDLVTIFDVMYGLEDADETRALEEVRRVLRPGGLLLWREPALMFLFGPHDRATHGKRRYTAGGLRSRLQRAGLEPLRLSYANTILFPLAVAKRFLARLQPDNGHERSDVQPVSEPLNSVLAKVLAMEAPVVSNVGLPVGLSVIGVARKA